MSFYVLPRFFMLPFFKKRKKNFIFDDKLNEKRKQENKDLKTMGFFTCMVSTHQSFITLINNDHKPMHFGPLNVLGIFGSCNNSGTRKINKYLNWTLNSI